jgi:LacI family transcriptional regulator
MSIRKIAEITGLSTATVSHVINNTRVVSKKNRDLVNKTIIETGYKPNMAAKALRTQRFHTVAMLMPTVEPGMSTNLYFIEVMSGAKDVMEMNGYNLIVSTYLDSSISHNNDVELHVKQLNVLQRLWVDGVILVPNKVSYKKVLENIGDSLPLVLVDRDIPEKNYSCVSSDHVQASFNATDLLIRNNKKRIAYIGGPEDSFTGHDRYEGYVKALAANTLPLDPSLVQMIRPYTVEEGYKSAAKVIEAGADSLFVANHVLTIGVMKYLQEKRIDVPEQVSVITFEDYEWMQAMHPPITSIRQNPYVIGRLAAEILLKRIKNPEYSEHVVLDAEIVIRKSHGNINE